LFLDHPGLQSSRQVERLQKKSFQELRAYLGQTSTASDEEEEDRFGMLLLRIPPLKALNPQVMEELFFAGLIGNVQIDSVIPYILRMEAGEYNGQLGK
jgi:hypothetical protein